MGILALSSIVKNKTYFTTGTTKLINSVMINFISANHLWCQFTTIKGDGEEAVTLEEEGVKFVIFPMKIPKRKVFSDLMTLLAITYIK